MNVQKGRYKLVSEDLFDSTCEYFDFSDEVKDFVPSCEDVPEVSIASIDAFTTAFPSAEYLGAFLEKKNFIDREEIGKTYYISYKHNVSKEDARLSTVWNDSVLHEISSHAKGGKVDFSNNTTKEMYTNMLRELCDKKSKFGIELLESANNDICINDYSKKYVKKCVFSSSFYEACINIKLREAFSNYREYRALYLAYTRYLKQKENKDNHTLGRK